jgi:hypothetical protein
MVIDLVAVESALARLPLNDGLLGFFVVGFQAVAQVVLHFATIHFRLCATCVC